MFGKPRPRQQWLGLTFFINPIDRKVRKNHL